MRKILVFNSVSVDGYFARPNGDIDWHVVDDEFNNYGLQLIDTVDTILFGRVTYELFESFWPRAAKDPSTSKDDLEIAHFIDGATKIVFSKSLKNVTWQSSQVLKEVNREEIQKLKEQPGKDIVVYGSGTIVQQLTNLGLIDEYRLMVNPVILGEGKPMFANIDDQVDLKLVGSKQFGSGNVLLHYKAKQV